MDNSFLILVTSICSMIISIVTVLGIISNYSDRLLKRMLKKGIESINPSELDPTSELSKRLEMALDHESLYKKLREDLDSRMKEVAEMVPVISEINKELQLMKRERFKSELRSRFEYTIMKKGKVDSIYWDHIVEDYSHYVNVLHMNSYMKSLYEESEGLYIKANVRREKGKK